jgi:K+-sensing histidine kinase KdpD
MSTQQPEALQRTFAATMALSFGAFLVLAALVTALQMPTMAAEAAFGVVIVVMAWRSTPAQAAVTALLAFLFVNGFVLGAQGTLSWSGEEDLVRLGAFVLLALAVSALRPQATVERTGTHQGGMTHG